MGFQIDYFTGVISFYSNVDRYRVAEVIYQIETLQRSICIPSRGKTAFCGTNSTTHSKAKKLASLHITT